MRKIVCLAVTLLSLSGCVSGTTAFIKNANSLAPADRVEVQASGAIDFVQIDDESANIIGDKLVHKNTHLYLAPGKHSFTFFFRAGSGARTREPLTLSGDFVAGHRYLLGHEISPATSRVQFFIGELPPEN